VHPNDLIEAARQALNHAHAPYSNYKVGAALLCADGSIVTGCNIENASFGLSNCAERTALFAAVAAGKTMFKAMAIAASSQPVPFPCGACRQVLSEFCAPDFPIHVATESRFETLRLGDLLPHGFNLKTNERPVE
jgi:cytidine deaminase